jgi:hypothetical protein
MPAVNSDFIIKAYEAINTGGNTVKAIVSALTSAAAFLDGGCTKIVETFINKAATWLFGKIMNDAKDYFLIACLIRVEYALRSGHLSMTESYKAFNLKNKCSKCQLVGHNVQNHSDTLQTYLTGKGILGNVNDGFDLIGE